MTVPDPLQPARALDGSVRISAPGWPEGRRVAVRSAAELFEVLGQMLPLDGLLVATMGRGDRGHYLYRDPTDGLVYLERRACAATGSRNRPVVCERRTSRAASALVLPDTGFWRRIRDAHDIWLTDLEAATALTTLAATGSYPQGFRTGRPVRFASSGRGAR